MTQLLAAVAVFTLTSLGFVATATSQESPPVFDVVAAAPHVRATPTPTLTPTTSTTVTTVPATKPAPVTTTVKKITPATTTTIVAATPAAGIPSGPCGSYDGVPLTADQCQAPVTVFDADGSCSVTGDGNAVANHLAIIPTSETQYCAGGWFNDPYLTNPGDPFSTPV